MDQQRTKMSKRMIRHDLMTPSGGSVMPWLGAEEAIDSTLERSGFGGNPSQLAGFADWAHDLISADQSRARLVVTVPAPGRSAW